MTCNASGPTTEASAKLRPLSWRVQGLHMTLDRWKKAMFRIGFLIEGRSNEEQPEQILGCAVLKGEASPWVELS